MTKDEIFVRCNQEERFVGASELVVHQLDAGYRSAMCLSLFLGIEFGESSQACCGFGVYWDRADVFAHPPESVIRK
jgi:hypothetical protein